MRIFKQGHGIQWHTVRHKQGKQKQEEKLVLKDNRARTIRNWQTDIWWWQWSTKFYNCFVKNIILQSWDGRNLIVNFYKISLALPVWFIRYFLFDFSYFTCAICLLFPVCFVRYFLVWFVCHLLDAISIETLTNLSP